MVRVVKFLSRPTGWLITGLFAFLVALPPTWAAPRNSDETRTENAPLRRQPTTEKILSIQKSLSEIGLYQGAISGRMNNETRAAIKIYQQSNGLKVDGLINNQLTETLENANSVRKLLSKLGKAREQKTSAARLALLSHPATKDLIDNNSDERADATRDQKSCLQNPTVRCLLFDASETAKAIFKTELRDWALGEILIVQGRAGLSQQAMQTAGRIKDPRLIMVALGDIAKALATARQYKNASDAITIIPDITERIDTRLSVARIHMNNERKVEALSTLKAAEKDINNIKDIFKRIGYEARKSLVLWRLGEQNGASKNLLMATDLARSLTDTNQRELAISTIATIYAKLLNTEQALLLMNEIDSINRKTPTLIKIVSAQAKKGDIAIAMATALNISQMRYRVIALGDIALAEIKSGNAQTAQAILNEALINTATIRLPYARSFAYSHLAKIYSQLRFLPLTDAAKSTPDKIDQDKAMAVANKINDTRLRAKTMWTIAKDFKKTGNKTAWSKTQQRAREETDNIIAPLSRVWLLSQITREYSRINNTEDANKVFQDALNYAQKIDNPWTRARALAKLASALLELAGLPQPATSAGERKIPTQR